MNHDAPMTPAAMQAHIAELEQQLMNWMKKCVG